MQEDRHHARSVEHAASKRPYSAGAKDVAASNAQSSDSTMKTRRGRGTSDRLTTAFVVGVLGLLAGVAFFVIRLDGQTQSKPGHASNSGAGPPMGDSSGYGGEKKYQPRPEEVVLSESERKVAEDARLRCQEANLQAKELPSAFKLPLGHVTMEFVLIQAGEFLMGSRLTPTEVSNRYHGKPSSFEDEHPLHRVIITKPFYLGRTEVTQAQWMAVMGENPSDSSGDDRPVENINWAASKEFCEKLTSNLNGHPQGIRVFRLPTEAEWEYACRAGTTTAFSFGDSREMLGDYGVYGANCDLMPSEVASKKPNPWGLYDMHGNVQEMCGDWWGEYEPGLQIDPLGPPTGLFIVVRDGPWHSVNVVDFRSASRERDSDTGSDFATGFRVAGEVSLQSDKPLQYR